MNRVMYRSWMMVLPLLLVGLASGCSNKDDGKPKLKSRSGTATKIDIDNRVVSMTTTDKKGNSLELDGTFNDDTVVVINGRNASIKDIRIGDKVDVKGYREGEGLNQKLIAVRVEVDRPDEKDWKPTGKSGGEKPAPTTQPANG